MRAGQLSGKRLGLRGSVDESLRVPLPSEATGSFSLVEDAAGSTVVDVMGVSIAIPA